MIQIGIKDDNQKAIPRKPERRPDRCGEMPTETWKMNGA
jgi:hypothetical protein